MVKTTRPGTPRSIKDPLLIWLAPHVYLSWHGRQRFVGGANKFLGPPTSDEMGRDGGAVQHFENGSLFWFGNTGVYHELTREAQQTSAQPTRFVSEMEQLMELGVTPDRGTAMAALDASGGDVAVAVSIILG